MQQWCKIHSLRPDKNPAPWTSNTVQPRRLLRLPRPAIAKWPAQAEVGCAGQVQQDCSIGHSEVGNTLWSSSSRWVLVHRHIEDLLSKLRLPQYEIVCCRLSLTTWCERYRKVLSNLHQPSTTWRISVAFAISPFFSNYDASEFQMYCMLPKR